MSRAASQSTGDSHKAIPPPILVDERSALNDLVMKVDQAQVIGVDTESNSLFAYYYRICLIQISLPDADYIVDPLAVDVTPLARMFASPDCIKIFHAAENDILGLKRDFGFEFDRVFDTMLAARILGWPRAGLGAILAERFGVILDKRMQRTNWGQRPLQTEQLAYAQLDTHYLLALQALQVEELRRLGRLAEAQESFERLPSLEFGEKQFDADNFWKVSGVRDLSPSGQAVLRELYIFREHQAQRVDRPPFKLLGEKQLIALARQQPTSIGALRQVRGVTAHQVRQWGQGIVAAVARGLASPPPKPPPKVNNYATRPDARTLARYDALREWRVEQAAARGVDPDVVLTNQALMALARLAPTTLKALAATEVLSASKLATYGESILRTLAKV